MIRRFKSKRFECTSVVVPSIFLMRQMILLNWGSRMESGDEHRRLPIPSHSAHGRKMAAVLALGIGVPSTVCNRIHRAARTLALAEIARPQILHAEDLINSLGSLRALDCKRGRTRWCRHLYGEVRARIARTADLSGCRRQGRLTVLSSCALSPIISEADWGAAERAIRYLL